MLNKEDLTRALSLLGDRLELAGSESVNLVVCGGSSLIITGLIARPATNDVDVLGLMEQNSNGKYIIKYSKPLPEIIRKAAEQVAADLGLDANWLNAGPADLVKYGLPLGMENRLEPHKFGKILTVNFISRLDQIHFKVYASVDSGPGRHVADLLELNPTADELEMAARWAIQQDPSEGFKAMLKQMLEAINFGTVAQRI